MASVNKTQKASDVVSCYRELASGVSVEHLFEKYVKAEVLIAFELFEKGVTLKQLQEFVQRRNAHIESMLNERHESSRYTTPSERKVIQHET